MIIVLYSMDMSQTRVQLFKNNTLFFVACFHDRSAFLTWTACNVISLAQLKITIGWIELCTMTA